MTTATFDPVSKILRVLLRKADTGLALTALTSASAGLIISTIGNNESAATVYTQAGSTIEAVTTNGTYLEPTATKCRFKKIDDTNHPGFYEIQLPTARLTLSGATSLVVSVTGVANLKDTHVTLALSNLPTLRTEDIDRAGL